MNGNRDPWQRLVDLVNVMLARQDQQGERFDRLLDRFERLCYVALAGVLVFFLGVIVGALL